MAGELAQRRGSRVALVQFQKHSKNLVTNSRLLVGHQPSQVPDIHTFKEELRILVDPVAKLSDTLLADLRVGVSISVSKCCVEDILEKSFQIVFVFHNGGRVTQWSGIGRGDGTEPGEQQLDQLFVLKNDSLFVRSNQHLVNKLQTSLFVVFPVWVFRVGGKTQWVFVGDLLFEHCLDLGDSFLGGVCVDNVVLGNKSHTPTGSQHKVDHIFDRVVLVFLELVEPRGCKLGDCGLCIAQGLEQIVFLEVFQLVDVVGHGFASFWSAL